MGRLGVQAFAFYSRLFKDLPSNIDVLEQVASCSFCLCATFQNILLRFAGYIFHGNALARVFREYLRLSRKVEIATGCAGTDNTIVDTINKAATIFIIRFIVISFPPFVS